MYTSIACTIREKSDRGHALSFIRNFFENCWPLSGFFSSTVDAFKRYNRWVAIECDWLLLELTNQHQVLIRWCSIVLSLVPFDLQKSWTLIGHWDSSVIFWCCRIVRACAWGAAYIARLYYALCILFVYSAELLCPDFVQWVIRKIIILFSRVIILQILYTIGYDQEIKWQKRKRSL